MKRYEKEMYVPHIHMPPPNNPIFRKAHQIAVKKQWDGKSLVWTKKPDMYDSYQIRNPAWRTNEDYWLSCENKFKPLDIT